MIRMIKGNEMSEFEKELESILEKIGEYYQGITTGNVLVISKHFKDWQPPKELVEDWQPPKELVEVPQCLADWFENQLKINELKKFDGNAVFRIIQDVIKVSNGESTWEDYGITDEIAKFAEDNEELFLNLIVNCSLGDGYTVEKEQLYVLKHIDMSKFSEDSSLYLSRSIKAEVFGKYDHMRVADGIDVSEIEQCHFTQSEIDELHTGSYEQIEVEP